jgi:hypothetical protein
MYSDWEVERVMKYFAEFDSNGFRKTSYVADGMPYTEEEIRQRFPDFVEISEEDQNLYVTGKYYRGADGKPVEITAYVPTAEEIKQQELSKLDAEYQPQFTALSQALGMATLAENTDLITSIKADYTELKAEYDGKREVITNG